MGSFFILFAISSICPVYTYFLYPLILSLFRKKEYKIGVFDTSITVIIIGENTEKKRVNIQQCKNSNCEIISGDYSCAKQAKGEIIVFTDTNTQLDESALVNIIKPFFDDSVGCVVGEQTNQNGNSLFWNYEKLVRRLESRIGCVSGASESLFAVRKADLPEIPDNVYKKPFYISSKIIEKGKAVLFQSDAKTYEDNYSRLNLNKHITDAIGYYQLLKEYPQMLLFHRGAFVSISHRVMKWFVWLSQLVLIITSGILGILGSTLMMILFGLQVIGYLVILVIGGKKHEGKIGKFLSAGYYFVMLNYAYFVGFFRKAQ